MLRIESTATPVKARPDAATAEVPWSALVLDGSSVSASASTSLPADVVAAVADGVVLATEQDQVAAAACAATPAAWAGDTVAVDVAHGVGTASVPSLRGAADARMEPSAKMSESAATALMSTTVKRRTYSPENVIAQD